MTSASQTIADLDLDMPADPTAERAVLGAVMLDRRLHDPVSEIITGADLWLPAHEQCWYAITDLIGRGDLADPITVAAELSHRGQLAGLGGATALADMIAEVTIPADAPVWAGIIHDRAVQRRTIQAATKIRQLAAQGGDDIPAMIEAAQATLDLLDPNLRSHSRTVVDGMADVIDHLGDNLAGLATPWPDLNRYLTGLAPGRLHVIGARPGVGKSLMAQGLAVHWSARHQQRVLFASLEMPEREMNLRMLSQASGVQIQTLTEGRYLTEADHLRIAETVGRMDQTHGLINLVARSEQTAASIRAEARALHRREGLGLVIVDYLQLLTPPDATRRDRNREQEVAETVRQFKKLAMDLDIPVVVLSQLNRALLSRSDKKPTMGDMRESGAIEQDADVIILLHQAEPEENPSDLEVILDKNRGGTKGTCHLIQQGWIANLGNLDRRHDERPAA